MKMDFGETFGEKISRVGKWHRWFAWYPVQVGRHDFRWLEIVERKCVYFSGYADDGFEDFYRSVK